MRKKLGNSELLALLTVAGIASGSIAMASENQNGSSPRAHSLTVIAQASKTQQGKEAACGKGSCGTDESGAKAAAEKHSGKAKKAAEAKDPPAKSSKKKANKKAAK